MKTWQFLLSKLKKGQRTILLYVIDNKGSSPGRKGFTMALAQDGQFEGTIGGGIMEVKLLELAKRKLENRDSSLVIKQQFHDKKHKLNQSGLICSGEQTVAIVSLSSNNQKAIQAIVDKAANGIKIGFSDKGIQLLDDGQQATEVQKIIEVNEQKRVHIFGGGHVGFALSQVLSLLDYYILLYDDRPNLRSFKENPYASEIQLVDYEKLDNFSTLGSEEAVVIVTSSYRTDKAVLLQLYKKTFFYIGIMGSNAKLAKLYEELAEKGVSKKELAHVLAPIGMPIASKTAMEIAISIAGEIIMLSNQAKDKVT